MKKTLVALAALASVGAAFAQSTVTLYGRVDIALMYLEQKVSTIAGTTKTATGNPGFAINSAGLTGSRWGLKGSEDLGGGLKAIFQLESGFNADTGASAQGGLLFGRQAYGGFEGNWGTFTVGRQYSPLDSVWGNYDAQGYTTNSAMGYAWGGAQTQAGGDIGRINNSIMYAIPNMSGFNASFMYAPGENNNPVTGQGNNQYIGFNVGYANGPFSTQLAYEGFKATAVPGVNIRGSRTLETWTIGANYDFKFMTLYGGFEQAKLDSNAVLSSAGGLKDQGWMIGVKVPISTMTMNLGYAYEKNKGNFILPSQSGEAWGFGGQLTYPLSKRSSLEANFLVGQNKNVTLLNAFQSTQKNYAYGAGFRTDF